MDMNIKGMDDILVGRARMAAMASGVTLKVFVIDALNEKLDREVVNGPRKTERTERAEGVSKLRSGVRKDRRTDGTGTVRRSQRDTQSESGTVERGVRKDSGEQGKSQEAGEREYLGPDHAAGCPCGNCPNKKRGSK